MSPASCVIWGRAVLAAAMAMRRSSRFCGVWWRLRSDKMAFGPMMIFLNAPISIRSLSG